MLVRRAFLATGLGCLAPLPGPRAFRPAAATEPAGSLRVYAWWGDGAASYLPNADFQGFFRSAIKSPEAEFDVKDTGPDKATVLDRLEKVDVFYANVHGGYLKDIDRHVWRLNAQGDVKDPSWYLSGKEIFDWRTEAGGGGRPIARLVVITGCDMVSKPPNEAVVPIPGAIGIGRDDDKRAFLGFGDKVTGVALDRYFRVFFGQWTSGQGESYPTLEETKQLTKDFILNWFKTQGEEKDDDPQRRDVTRRRHYMNRQDTTYSDELQIIGHSGMRYPELLRASLSRQKPGQPGNDPGRAPRPRMGTSENVGDLLSDRSKKP